MIYDELRAELARSASPPTATMLDLAPRPRLDPWIVDARVGRITADRIEAGVICRTAVRPYGRHARRDGD